jgi:acetolactate synthase-1/2/3 large subunit
VLLVGQVASDQEEREAFQEIDYRRMFGPMAKWIAQVDRPERIPELVARAFSTACAGRPGPVVLALPEDVLAAEVDVADAPRFHRIQPSARHEDIVEFERLLAAAARPLAIPGGGGWTPAASTHMAAFLAANELPAGAAFRRRTRSTTTTRGTSATSGSASIPSSGSGSGDADLLLVVGPGWGDDDLRLHAARRSRAETDARARPPGRKETRSASTSRRYRSSRRPSRSPRLSPSYA